jgi:sulfotransferase family protein
MLGAMIGGHPQCVCVPESHFIEHLLTRGDFNPRAVEPRKTLARIIDHERYRLLWNLSLDPEAIDPAELGSSYADVLSWLVRAYGRHLGKPTAQLWVDHTPSNFKRGLAMLSMFPDARFIHLVRDGRGVAASILPLDWGPNDVLAAAEFWMARCAAGLAAELRLGPERVLRIRYEDLLLSPERTLRTVAEFAGLSYEPAMAQGTGHSPSRYNERQHRLVGQPPDQSRAHSWNHSLTPRQIEIFEAEAGGFLETLGYQPEYGVRARPAGPTELLRMNLEAVVLRLRNNLRRRRRIRASLVQPPTHRD